MMIQTGKGRNCQFCLSDCLLMNWGIILFRDLTHVVISTSHLQTSHHTYLSSDFLPPQSLRCEDLQVVCQFKLLH